MPKPRSRLDGETRSGAAAVGLPRGVSPDGEMDPFPRRLLRETRYSSVAGGYMINQAPSHRKIVIFTFAGRESYLEIQKDFILDIVTENTRVEYHLWNFSRNESDNLYLQRLSQIMPRTKIFDQFYEGSNSVDVCTKRIGELCGCKKCRVGKYSEPYKYYSSRDEYRETLFVKLDDDIVFLESANF
jgi:hypothetical protein